MKEIIVKVRTAIGSDIGLSIYYLIFGIVFYSLATKNLWVKPFLIGGSAWVSGRYFESFFLKREMKLKIKRYEGEIDSLRKRIYLLWNVSNTQTK